MWGSVPACTLAILSIGASGMIAQTLLLRELLSQFAGSEFSVGLIIGNWVAAEALGAFAAGRFMKDPSLAVARFIRLTILFSLLFPALLFLARTWRAAAALPLHEAVSLWQILAASIILVFPSAIIQGAQFVLATSVYGEITGKCSDSPGRVYGIETVGTVIGGTAASFLLLPLLNPFQTAVLLLLANGVICIYLRRMTPASRKQPGYALLLLPLLLAALFIAGGASSLDSASLKLQWSGDTLVESRSTPYQNISVIRSQEQFTFYSDGTPLFSLPDPDIAKLEETAHLSLLAHPDPQRVLVLGGGAGGIVAEILKHPSVARVDYLELDPATVQTVEKYAPPTLLQQLHDPRVRIQSRDGRAFLREAKDRYDVVLIGAPLPLNLQGNRYFTAEFLGAIRRVLHPAGLLSISSTGSMSYYGDDLKEVTRSLVATIRSVFPHLLVVPGDSNLFVASAKLPLETLTAADFSKRLANRGVKTALISTPHLQWLLGETPLQWFNNNIGEGGVINADFLPYLLIRHLSYSTIRLNPEMKPLLELFARVKFTHVAVALALATLASAAGARRKPVVAINWVIATTGFTAMLLELAFFFSFQLFQGVMLRTIGLLIAIFMAGLWGGSRVTYPTPVCRRQDMQRLFAGELLLLFLSGGLWLIASGAILHGSSATPFIYLLLLPLIFLAGLAAGAQFPPAARLTTDSSGAGPAMVYGWDLLGGWLGGVLGGALLLPLLGFAKVALLLVLLKSGSILCLYLYGKMDKI